MRGCGDESDHLMVARYPAAATPPAGMLEGALSQLACSRLPQHVTRLLHAALKVAAGLPAQSCRARAHAPEPDKLQAATAWLHCLATALPGCSNQSAPHRHM